MMKKVAVVGREADTDNDEERQTDSLNRWQQKTVKSWKRRLRKKISSNGV